MNVGSCRLLDPVAASRSYCASLHFRVVTRKPLCALSYGRAGLTHAPQPGSWRRNEHGRSMASCKKPLTYARFIGTLRPTTLLQPKRDEALTRQLLRRRRLRWPKSSLRWQRRCSKFQCVCHLVSRGYMLTQELETLNVKTSATIKRLEIYGEGWSKDTISLSLIRVAVVVQPTSPILDSPLIVSSRSSRCTCLPALKCTRHLGE